MALEIRTFRDVPPPAAVHADRRLYLTADRGHVVEEGDPGAAFLLAGAGSEIPASEMARLGLRVEAARVVIMGAAASTRGRRGQGQRRGSPDAAR